jgi:uncharacterized membrane protein YcaP (DUF421 family)
MGSGMFSVGWSDMFVLGVPLIEKIIRPILVYAFLVIGLRLAGKRELVQLNPFDFVVLLTISNTVQNAIIGNESSVTGGVIGAITLLAVNYVVVRFFFSHPQQLELLTGKATLLMEDGQIIPPNLDRELITEAELSAVARKQGFDDLSEVKSATLDPGGFISFVHKDRSPEDIRHDELMHELKLLRTAIHELQSRASAP